MGSVIVYLLRCSNFRSHIEIIRHFICNNYLICNICMYIVAISIENDKFFNAADGICWLTG